MSLTHTKVSTKTDGSDSSLIQPSDWNADHVFGGGDDGQVLVRDSGEASGFSWTSTPITLTTWGGAVGTDANTNEKDLWSWTMPAGTMASNYRTLRITAWGTTAADDTNKTFRLYFGTTVLATMTAAGNNAAWWVEAMVVQLSNTTQAATAVMGMQGIDDLAPAASSPTATLTGEVILRLAGQNGEAELNGIVCRGVAVEAL